jgi:cation:H+ antiporter
MEQSASKLGDRHGVSDIVIGALVLAAVTSLPNAVSAVYLALRGKAQATLSIATNSNAINVAAGLLIPAIVVGLGTPSHETMFVAAWYLGLTVVALAGAYAARGLGRRYGVLIIGAYIVFAALVVATAD